MSQLTKLVVKGLSVRNLVKDLQQLTATKAAAEAPWQLHELVLHARCDARSHWSEYAHVLQQLTTAFRSVKRLNIAVPWLTYTLGKTVPVEAEAVEAAAHASESDSDTESEPGSVA